MLITALRSFSAEPPSIDETLNQLWGNKQYADIKNLIDIEIEKNNPDVAALYCAKFFYVFVQPDKDKALATTNKLKTMAANSGQDEFIAFANEEHEEVQNMPESEFVAPTQAILDALHAEFIEKFPNIDMGLRLRKWVQP